MLGFPDFPILCAAYVTVQCTVQYSVYCTVRINFFPNMFNERKTMCISRDRLNFQN